MSEELNDNVAPLRFTQAITKALSVWRTDPWLPIVSIAMFLPSSILYAVARAQTVSQCPALGSCRIGITPGLRGIAGLLEIVEMLFFIGFAGAQRVWFMRAFRGLRTSGEKVWRIALEMWPRFFGLGLMFFFAAMIASAISIIFGAPGVGSFRGSFVVMLVLYLVLDFALTFATPALALTDPSPPSAIARGLRLARRTMPRSLPYVVIPGLLPLVIGGINSPHPLGAWGPLILGTIGSAFNVLMKGATVAFYVQHEEVVSDDGAPRPGRGLADERERARSQRRTDRWAQYGDGGSR